MKLLLDQNLSEKLLNKLGSIYPGSSHVRHLGLQRADDESIWNFAKDHGFTIVSKDSDFHQRSFLFGFPPKVIWIRSENCSTAQIDRILRDRHSQIKLFHQDEMHAFLVLF